VHGQLLDERGDFVAVLLAGRDARDFDEHADLAAEVRVGADQAAVAVEARDARNRHVLAGLGDGGGQLLADRGLGGDQRLRIAAAVAGRERVEHFADERLERIRARDEVRFTVHFGDDAALAAVEDADADQAFVGGASRALRRLGESALAEDGGGLFEVAVSLGESLLALHHAGAGLVAQRFYLFRGDSHVVLRNSVRAVLCA
jgi:hypothetical protein